MATIDIKTNLGVEIDDIEMTDEHGTEWIKVEYSYECPNDNYLDGWDNTDTIETVYIGPKYLYFFADKETGQFERVYRDFELPDEVQVEPAEETSLIKFDCAEDPLAAEVLSDYHNNFMDAEDYIHEVGQKIIESPPGYENFEYPYPIHPDELYCDQRSYWDFETKKIVLVKNTMEDIIGPAPTWVQIREHRMKLLANTDAQYLALKALGDSKADEVAELERYRQLLRDLPQAMEDAGIPQILVDSMLPRTTLIDFGETDYDEPNT